ncbi:hypothetical protein DEU38_12065 [Rhodococcus sp. AG1013]|uniref:hypothetical protein n=1 Tax=Rhodococcus sp. AG1013 TaxID=2183996 RepID=UPI000E2D3E31|nr:hypothetical protein [Rhodococcus sp. AG1013]RDI18497.1 hypothetical protein DEU38_12065 [Rhodococcus sp. AG1013]
MIDGIPPHLRSAYDRLMNSADSLATERIRAERQRHGDWDTRTEIDDAFMDRLAAMPDVSDELRAYAARVAAGECRWEEIEWRAAAVPPEIAELRQSRHFVWFRNPTPRPTPVEEDEAPYRFQWE